MHWKRPCGWEKLKSKGEAGMQRMKWLDSIANSMDINLSKLQETVEGRGACLLQPTQSQAVRLYIATEQQNHVTSIISHAGTQWCPWLESSQSTWGNSHEPNNQTNMYKIINWMNIHSIMNIFPTLKKKDEKQCKTDMMTFWWSVAFSWTCKQFSNASTEVWVSWEAGNGAGEGGSQNASCWVIWTLFCRW